MKINHLIRAIVLLSLLISLVPVDVANALAAPTLPPPDMFQLPWDQGIAWVSLDGFDNGFKRLLNSPHNYLNGGAVDFAPRVNMKVGENTSNYWVTAAAAGTVVEKSFCHLKINHGNGWTTEYQFLANIQVKLGDAVFRNQRLAIIANGSSQPFCPPDLKPDIPHLHFSLRPTMLGASFAGWVFNYNPLLNRTTFTKNGQTLTSYEALLNVLDLQIVLREPITWDIVYIGSVDTFLYDRWPFTLNETTTFTLTANPTTAGLVPLLLLLDSNGTEIARGSGTLTSTQPAGSYFVQVQPQSGSGFYNLVLTRDSQPSVSEPSSSTTVETPSIHVGESSLVSVSLNNVPTEGYTSAEFTCTYDPAFVEVSNIVVTGLFGADPAVAINGPLNGAFIVAVAGTSGNRATTNGTVFTFNAKGLQVGQTMIGCTARVSKGDNILTTLPSTAASLNILGVTPIPTDTPPPDVTPTPIVTATPTPPVDGLLTFTNTTYGFEFKYPQAGQIADGRTDNFARLDFPFQDSTNLREKYLEVIVAENVSLCQSPLATQSMLETSETVTVNSISFLKQTGEDGGAGNLHQWIAYSTSRDNACISLDFILHSLNPGNFPTPPPVFDYAAETAVLGQMVSTFAWLTSPTPDGMLSGRVNASKTVTVTLYNAENVPVASTAVTGEGTLSLTAPAGTYTVVATAFGFLSVQGPAILTAGSTTTMPTISLSAGDIDGNNVIDPFDALTIGMSYNTALPTAADLNNDGIINVLDLEALALNYRMTGPVLWQ